MKTNELNNGIKEVYTKPALEVEEMEVQWEFLTNETSTDKPSQGELICAADNNQCPDDCEEHECPDDV